MYEQVSKEAQKGGCVYMLAKMVILLIFGALIFFAVLYPVIRSSRGGKK